MFSTRPKLSIGKYILSIQAGKGYYCDPKKDNLPIEHYKSVEIAIWTSEDDSFLDVTDVTPELKDYFNGCVYGYVPTDLIPVIKEKLALVGKSNA